MDLNLADRVVLVAGSSRGIGLAVAASALAEGARVAISGRHGRDLEEAAIRLGRPGPARLLALEVDLATAPGAADALRRVEQEWGRLDVVVANIGRGAGRRGWDQGAEAWMASFDANLWPAVHLCEAALPHLAAQGGAVVLIGSIAGRQRLGAPIPYGVAKAAVGAYTSYLAAEAAPLGVRVNCVAPGNVLVPDGVWDRRGREDPDGLAAYLAAEVPMGRLGQPEEIADVVCFLASPRASFLTGACVIADGGQTRTL